MKQALEGIRVIDLSVLHLGPSAAAMLADIGAEVIHVEDREHGDPIRAYAELYGVPLVLPGGRHALFEDLNRNKKGMTLDLRKPGGREIMYRLVEKSDVFLTNLRRRALKGFGMDYESLSKGNPRLVYASASSFGEKGPEADTPGIEFMGFARSGFMMNCGERGMPPIAISPGSGDRAAGILLAYGVLAALVARERLGVGQEVSTSHLGAMVALQSASLITYLLTGREIERRTRQAIANPLASWYECKDGRWIAFGALQSQRYWGTFCRGLGRPELEHDPRFETAEKRRDNCSELISIMDREFATLTCTEWEQRFKEAGDMLISRVNTVSDLASDPQVLENEYIIDKWQDGTQAKAIGFPVKFSRTPARLRLHAPHFGQHTEEVLLEVCGYSWPEIEEFRQKEVI